MIKKLYGLVLKNFFILFFATFVVTLFVFVLQTLWLYASDILGKSINLSILAQLLGYQALAFIPLSLPITVMIASIMTFGNMGEHFELTAVKSAGISLLKIMKPFFYLVIVISLLSFYVANTIVPYALLKSYVVIVGVRQKHPSLRLQESIFNYDVAGYVIRIGKKNPKTNMMYDFMIYDHKNYQGNKMVVTADSGQITVTDDLKYMIIRLYEGSEYEELKEGIKTPKEDTPTYPYHQDLFESETIIIHLKGFDFKEADQSFYSNNYNLLNYNQLRKTIDSLSLKTQQTKEYYFKIIYGNDILKSQVKLRTHIDSVNNLFKIQKLNKIPADSLTVIYNIDSVLNTANINKKKDIYNTAIIYAQNSLNRLKVYKAEYENKTAFLINHKIALNEKYVYALACLIFFFIGAPLGAIIRKGGFGLPTIISVVLFLVFYIIITFGQRVAIQGKVSAFVGTWFAVFIFVPFEIYIFYKAITDSAIFNWDYYKDRLNKIFRKIFPKFLRPRYLRRKMRNRRKNENINNNK